MVQLTVTSAAKAAIEQFCKLRTLPEEKTDTDAGARDKLQTLSNLELGSPIDHSDLIDIFRFLNRSATTEGKGSDADRWRLDTLLKGTAVYQPPPPRKPEQTAQYKALMQRLRKEEEQRQYERMLNPLPPRESFSQRFPTGVASFQPQLSHGRTDGLEVDEVTYQDINRQATLIINVLVTIIASSVTIWFAARYWSVPQRLALCFTGSIAIAIAEVVVYMGYIRRIKDAKGEETKKIERKEVGETWVIEKTPSKSTATAQDALRHRKGKHR